MSGWVAVWTTRVGITRIISDNWLNGQRLSSTICERIPNVSTLTSAGWDVVDHPAEGIGATQARARIYTVKLLTSLV